MAQENYNIKVNDSMEFDFTIEDADKLDLISLGKGKYHLLNNNKSEEVEVLKIDFIHKKYEVMVNGNKYEVVLNNSLDILIKDLGFEVGAGKIITDLNSPMPGLILEVNVQEGDEVKEGDTLLILEAMKMENVISSPRDGVIKSVHVTPGEAIEKSQLLISFE
ncbi:biotin/lipoyl-binding protein [Flavobacteriaceae bacterium Ap0902]|nr:biotin/lipoyl-binding protein [Flavobacteriaceae bacterium Ap0902]